MAEPTSNGDYPINIAESVNKKFGDLINDEGEHVLSTDYGTEILEMAENSVRDALTGAYNRAYLVNELEKIPEDEDVTIVMVDIDEFKNVNDTYGHLVGDKALINTTNILSENVHLVGNGVRDIVARYGGEEFVLLLRHFTNKDQVKEKVDNIRRLVESSLIRNEGKDFKVTISSGIANRKEGETMEELLDRADKALYQAKQGGRNRVVVSKSV